jgi:hypothetical protein
VSLSIKKFNYSRGPWRITLNNQELWLAGQPYFCFERKRDAKPFLERLSAVGDWGNFAYFTESQKSAVGAIIKDTPYYQLLNGILSRPKTPFC